MTHLEQVIAEISLIGTMQVISTEVTDSTYSTPHWRIGSAVPTLERGPERLTYTIIIEVQPYGEP